LSCFSNQTLRAGEIDRERDVVCKQDVARAARDVKHQSILPRFGDEKKKGRLGPSLERGVFGLKSA